MLGTLSTLAITSLFSLGSYAYSIAIPSPSPLVSPLPIQQKNPTPIPPSPTPSRANEPTSMPTSTVVPTATPIPTATATPMPQQPITTPPDLDSLFQQFSNEYAVDKELLKRIANCESGFNTNAENGDYHGMFQFASSSWIATRGEMGLDPNTDLRKDAQEAIRTTAYKISHGGIGAWPSCGR